MYKREEGRKKGDLNELKISWIKGASDVHKWASVFSLRNSLNKAS